MTLSCAVLAGGESRRMGRNKALVDLEGRPLLAHIVERASAWSDDVFVVAKDTQLCGLDLRIVRDATDVQTPLAGIVAALREAAHSLVFVCATDMPFVSRDLVALLASHAAGVDAVAPIRDGRPESLHAIWSVSASEAVGAALASGERAVHRVLERLRTVMVDESRWRAVDPDAISFTNINTPAELRDLGVPRGSNAVL